MDCAALFGPLHPWGFGGCEGVCAGRPGSLARGDPRENFGGPLENLRDPRENFGDPRENFGDPRENFGDPRENLGVWKHLPTGRDMGMALSERLSNPLWAGLGD